jgi:hypothetical protein
MHTKSFVSRGSRLKLSCHVIAWVQRGLRKSNLYSMSIFKRPTIRRTFAPAQVFQTKQVNGAQVSQWVADDRKAIIPNGTPGRVGEIVDAMRKGAGSINHEIHTPWTPPCDFEFYMRKMVPEEEQEAYAAKCKEWHDAHPPKEFKQPPPPLPEYNREMIIKFWQGKKNMPPLEDRIQVFRAAGMPEELIKKHIAWDAKMVETSDKRQKQIEKIFGKYTKTKTKPATKTKPKVLKPVKKKMI